MNVVEKIFITREQKDLLLKDICARLPYGVKLQNVYDTESIVRLRSIDLDDYCYEIMFYTYEGKALTVCDRSKLFRFGKVLRYRPCLFPLSSMTEEQREELYKMGWYLDEDKIYSSFRNYDDVNYKTHTDCFELINWCYINKFDINGLIPLGLAVDATGLNVY